MTRRNANDVIGLWLEEGPVVAPGERRSQMLGEILATPQSRGWRTRFRATSSITPVSLGMSATAVFVVLVAGALGFNSVQPGNESVDSSCEVARAAAPNEPQSRAQTTQGPSTSAGGRWLDAGPLPAGTIELETLDPPISLRLGSGWWAGYDYGDDVQAPPGKAAIERRLEAGGFVRIGFWDTTHLTITDPTSHQEMSAPSDFVRFLLDIESIEDCVLTSVELGELTATRVDFDWTIDQEPWLIQPVEGALAHGFEFQPSERQHWFVASDGQLLINWTVESSPATASPLSGVRSQISVVRDMKAAEVEADRLVDEVLETLELSAG